MYNDPSISGKRFVMTRNGVEYPMFEEPAMTASIEITNPTDDIAMCGCPSGHLYNYDDELEPGKCPICGDYFEEEEQEEEPAMTTATRNRLTTEQIEEARTTLRSAYGVQPGTTVYTSPVNNAGTYFKLYVVHDGELQDITWNACRAMGVNPREDSHGRWVAHETVYGMSRSFNLVYNLSSYLFRDMMDSEAGYALKQRDA